MREKLLSLPLAELREIARSKGIKNIAATRKSALVDKLVAIAEEEALAAGTEEAGSKTESSQEPDLLAEALKDRTVISQVEAAQDNTGKSGSKVNTSKESTRKESAAKESTGKESASHHKDSAGKDTRGTTHRSTSASGESKSTKTTETKAARLSAEQKDKEYKKKEYNDNHGKENASPEGLVRPASMRTEEMAALDSGVPACGILEVMQEGFGFIRSENYLPGENDVYVSPSQIRRFNMKTGDIVFGSKRIKTGQEKFAALLYVNKINDLPAEEAVKRPAFEDLTPIFPDSRLHLETPGSGISMRIVDILSPIGKGQRGMIVAPPKAGKTTLLKMISHSIIKNHPDVHVIILLIDERPEEVTDIRESIESPNAEVIYSTFDELPEHHKRVAEMVLERAKRLVEHGRDVIILLDSITRLARAYNLTVSPSGRTLSGGLDPAALHMPKKFFGAARNMREGGSLTVLATALVDTGSRLDDMVYEEFKGTGNMELVLNRHLSERRIFPAIDIYKSGTRNEDRLLTKEEREAVNCIRRAISGARPDDAVESVLDLFSRTKNNKEFIEMVKKIRF